MVRSAAAMEAGHQVAADGRAAALAVLPTTGGAAREPEGLPCPRCESVHTKFCYYNNYNLSQPRHFCKTCRRYWTRGGSLRNVPVGGGTRKPPSASAARRKQRAGGMPPPPVVTLPAPATASPTATASALRGAGSLLRPYGVGGIGGLSSFAAPTMASPLAAVDPDRRLLDLGGSFTSLIAPGADVGVHFLLGGLAPATALPRAPASAAALPPPPPPTQHQQQAATVSQALPEGVFWSMGWPDLSI